jgi:beta-RFAP synthase
MIDKPGIVVNVVPSTAWSATGPSAERALAYAHAFLCNSPELEQRPFELCVERCPPEHVGLGTGTQLGLAVAKALAAALRRPDWDACFLARRIGRGQRSGIGVHGFEHGGFLVDGGKGAATFVAPLIARHDFPSDWGILLVVPNNMHGVHGASELEAFASLAQNDTSYETDALCRLALLGMLPALVERDLPAFSEALYEFNRRVGETFKPWQGGTYRHPLLAEVVHFLRRNGVPGVGQSSWGPAVFAMHSVERCADLAAQLQKHFGFCEDEVLTCSAANTGYRLV